jgi:hypothetical protein
MVWYIYTGLPSFQQQLSELLFPLYTDEKVLLGKIAINGVKTRTQVLLFGP